MKYILCACIICFFFCNATAQTVDTSLKFNQRFTKCELKWVVMPKSDTSGKYFYGFVYIDLTAGFTLDVKGFFTIGANGHYMADTSLTKTGIFKYRLGPNIPYVALLPVRHFKELNIQSRPKWVDIYYGGIVDTAIYYNYRMGFNFNAAGDSEAALKYLDKAYKANPHYKGLEFEMAYAYNALNRTDDAIAVLENAVKYDPKNIMFYRELGYAYLQKNNYDKAINFYKQGIELYPDTKKPDDSKAEIAFNMASIFKKMGKDDDYKEWMLKAKEWSLPNSNIYRAAVTLGF